MKQNYFIMYLIIVGVQLLICNYFHVTAYITLSLLPCAILCMPTKIGPSSAMLIAFATGLTVDFLAEGIVGINALALVPVAGARRWIFDMIIGKEIIASGEDISMKKLGVGAMLPAIVIAQSIFLFIYIWADGASARPAMFNILRFVLSLITGSALSLIMAQMLDPNERK